jgi:hypothetical protein
MHRAARFPILPHRRPFVYNHAPLLSRQTFAAGMPEKLTQRTDATDDQLCIVEHSGAGSDGEEEGERLGSSSLDKYHLLFHFIVISFRVLLGHYYFCLAVFCFCCYYVCA